MIDIGVDLRPALGDVRDQGPRPTCLAHAVSAAHEHARGSAVALSPEYVHFFSKCKDRSSGVSMDKAAMALKNEGQPEEVHCRYLPVDPPAGWKPADGLSVFRRGSERKTADASEVEGAIRTGRVPVLGITLPESFFVPKAPWVISSQGAIRGLHAVAAIGIGRHQGTPVILIRNSWGAAWGDGGHAWLDRVFIAQHLQEVVLLTVEAVQ